MRKDSTITQDPRDRKILEIVAELSNKLGIKIFPLNLLWKNSLVLADSPKGTTTQLGSDECIVQGHDRIVLPRRMRDRLEPEDWRPIIASSLILRFKLRRSIFYKIFTRLMLVPLVLIATGIALFTYYPSIDPNGPNALMVVGLVGGFFITRFFFGSYFQRAKLVADRQATDLVGRQTFLYVLGKIDQMKLWDEKEYSKDKMHSAEMRLAMDLRINNIQNYS